MEQVTLQKSADGLRVSYSLLQLVLNKRFQERHGVAIRYTVSDTDRIDRVDKTVQN